VTTLLIVSSFAPIPSYAADWNWISLGGATIESPAVTGIYDGSTGNHERIDIVVRGSDNGIYHKFYDWSVGWSGWTSLGGSTSDKPAIAYADYSYKDTLHVVVRGMNNALYHKKFDIATSTWDSSWTWIDPIAEPWYAGSAPVLVPFSNGNLILVFRGTDNYLYYARWEDYWVNFAGKTWLQGQTPDEPAVNVYGDQIHIVVRGMDDGLYWRNGSLLNYESLGTILWASSWTSLPGSTLSPPTLTNNNLVVRGTDNAIYYKYFDQINGYWTGWTALGGATTSRPALWISDGPLVVWYLYARGTDNGIYRRTAWWTGGIFYWDTWESMQGQTSAAPSIDAGNLVVRGTDDTPYILQWWS
jgi:hypothetical protein